MPPAAPSTTGRAVLGARLHYQRRNRNPATPCQLISVTADCADKLYTVTPLHSALISPPLHFTVTYQSTVTHRYDLDTVAVTPPLQLRPHYSYQPGIRFLCIEIFEGTRRISSCPHGGRKDQATCGQNPFPPAPDPGVTLNSDAVTPPL